MLARIKAGANQVADAAAKKANAAAAHIDRQAAAASDTRIEADVSGMKVPSQASGPALNALTEPGEATKLHIPVGESDDEDDMYADTTPLILGVKSPCELDVPAPPRISITAPTKSADPLMEITPSASQKASTAPKNSNPLDRTKSTLHPERAKSVPKKTDKVALSSSATTQRGQSSASKGAQARRSRPIKKSGHPIASGSTQASASATNQARRSRLPKQSKNSTARGSTQAEASSSSMNQSGHSASSSAQSQRSHVMENSVASSSQTASSANHGSHSSASGNIQEVVHPEFPPEYMEQDHDPYEEDGRFPAVAPSPKVRVVASKQEGGLFSFISGFIRKDPLRRLVGYEEGILKRFYIGGLPSHCDAGMLRTQFSKYGHISACDVCGTGPNRRGYITFEGENTLEIINSKITMEGAKLEVKMYMPQADAPEAHFGSQAADNAERYKVATNLASKGFTVKWLVNFWRKYGERPPNRTGSWTRGDGTVSKGLKPAKGQWKGRIKRTSETNDVVRDLVIPDTADLQCCYMDMVPGVAVKPGKLVSHWWGANFRGDVLCILQDAIRLTGEALTLYLDYDYAPGLELDTENEALQLSYWMCIFAVNQHVSICGMCNDCNVVSTTRSCSVCHSKLYNPCPCGTSKWKTGHVLCQMDKFDVVMAQMAKGLAVALDSQVKTLTRVWVLSEIGKSFESDKEITWLMPNEIDDRFCAEKDEQIPSIRDCSASLPVDKERILQQVDNAVGIKVFDTNVNDRVSPILRRYALRKVVMGGIGHDVVRFVLNRRADPDSEVSTGKSVLHEAASSGKLHVLKHLLSARASIDNQDDLGATPIFISAEKAKTDVLDHLLNAKGGVDMPNNDGVTPLNMVAHNGHKEIVTVLINNRADVNFANNEGRTPLHRSAQKGHLEIVQLLIAERVDINRADKYGLTPLAIAKVENMLSGLGLQSSVEARLVEAGAHIFPSRRDMVKCENGHKLDKKVGSQEVCNDCGAEAKPPEHVFRCRTCTFYLCQQCYAANAEEAEKSFLVEQAQKQEDLILKRRQEQEAKRRVAETARGRKGFFAKLRDGVKYIARGARNLKRRGIKRRLFRGKFRVLDFAARSAKAKANHVRAAKARAVQAKAAKAKAHAENAAKAAQQVAAAGQAHAENAAKAAQQVAAAGQAVRAGLAEKFAPGALLKNMPAAAVPKGITKDTPTAATAASAPPKATPKAEAEAANSATSTAAAASAPLGPKPKAPAAPKAPAKPKASAKIKTKSTGKK